MKKLIYVFVLAWVSVLTLPHAARAQVKIGAAWDRVRTLPVENQFFEFAENEDDLKQIVAFGSIELVT